MHPTTSALLDSILALKTDYRMGKFQVINGDDTAVIGFTGQETPEERALFDAFIAALPHLASDLTRPVATAKK